MTGKCVASDDMVMSLKVEDTRCLVFLRSFSLGAVRSPLRKNTQWSLNSRQNRAGHAADRSLTIRNGNTSQTTAGSVRKNTGQASSQEPARGAEGHLHSWSLYSIGQITARSAGQSSGRLRWSQGHAGGVGVSSHSRPLLNTGRITAGNARRRGISES